MKRVLPLHTLTLLAALLCTFTATAYAYDFDFDFEVDHLKYSITSDTTVKVSGQSLWDFFGENIAYFEYHNIIIPEHVTFNNTEYTITEIGDSAFYYDTEIAFENGQITFDLNVTIPKTVTCIGYMAFYYFDLANIICLSTTPPTMNNIVNDGHYGIFNLFVPAEAYSLYQELNNQNHYFDTVYITDGKRSNPPRYNEIYLRQPVDSWGAYGCAVKLYTGENTIVYKRHTYNFNGLWTDDYYSSGWERCDDLDSLYFYHESDCYNEGGKPDGWQIEFFAIEEGKSPSYIVSCGDLASGEQEGKTVNNRSWVSFVFKWSESFDFMDSNICFDVSDHEVGVTFQGYDYPCGEQKGKSAQNENRTDSVNINQSNVTVRSDGWSLDDCDELFYYSGEIEIPSTATYHNYYNDTFTTYPVVYIGHDAFYNCVDLTSIKLPNTIKDIGANAFYGCSHLKKMELPVSITYIAEDAFKDCISETISITGEGEWQGGALPGGVKTLFIGSGVTGVKGMQVNPETIYSYATTPPVCDENSFTGYEAELHVPAASLAAYFTAPYWCNFTNIIGDAVPLTELTLNHDSIEVLVGNQANLTATLNPTNAMPSAVIWQSSDTTVATINNGVVTALKAGSCDIFATCQDKRAVCHVNVTEFVPTAVIVTPESAKIEVGTQLTLAATVLPEDATNKTISWWSSNRSIATVDANGVVTAVGPGECNITAWCRGKSAKCHLIVVEHLIYITLDQHEASLLPNHMITLTPSVAPVSTDLVVTSSNPEVAAARLAGSKIQVVGVSEGEATIVIGSADGYAEPDSCMVTVYTERGDANNDGFVNISDITSMITYLMTGNASDFSTVNADCNGDGKVTISDVTLLISHLMSGTELKPKDQDNEEITVNGVTFKMMRVKGGTFQMGSTTDQDPDAEAIESPVHAVTLSTYYMGMTEVTQELWQAVMGENPSEFTGDAQRPVERVTWEMCQEFITTLNALTGKTFRLPTEAEWEFAARGGNKSAGYRYAGSNDIDEVAWYSLNSDSAPHPVGLKAPNELGMFDMTGNVGEWCADRYGYYTEDAQTDPQGPETGKSRIYRGGSWPNNAKSCRLTRRAYFSPATIRNNMGLRLAL